MTAPGISKEDCYNCTHEFHEDICQKPRSDSGVYRLSRPVVLGGPIPLCGCRGWIPVPERAKSADGLTQKERARRSERNARIERAEAEEEEARDAELGELS